MIGEDPQATGGWKPADNGGKPAITRQQQVRGRRRCDINYGTFPSFYFFWGIEGANVFIGIFVEEDQMMQQQEGVPAGGDGMVDQFVDSEADQYLGGNKDF